MDSHREPLNPDSWRRIGAVLDRVSSLDVHAQPAALAEACREEGIGPEEVERFLTAERNATALPEQIDPLVLEAALRGFADVPPSKVLAAGDRLGPYEIVAQLGAGGMGEVYKARDTRLGRTVALKRLHADLAARIEGRLRFEREARAISALNHPHICTLFDVGRQDDDDFLVMELVEGETLAWRLKRGALPVEEALRYSAQIGDALAAAHREGVVHRDLKPANIMLTSRGVKLLDFGLAALHTTESIDGSGDAALTARGTILGTPAYMAPEQLHGRPTDARTDVFALGAVIHEMLTGRRAFEGASSAGVIAAILERDPEPVSKDRRDIPEGVAWTVRTCLAKDPDERWQNAADVARHIQWISAAPDAAGPAAMRSPRPRTIGLIAAAIVLASIASVALTRALWRQPASPATPTFARFALNPPDGHAYDRMHALSPDGSRIAFATVDIQGKRALWTRALDALSPQRMAGTDGASYPFWSPDGRFIAFFATSALKKVELTTGTVEVICNCDTGLGAGGTWNRDGVILFSKGLVISPLWRVPASGGQPVAVTALKAPAASDGDRPAGDQLPLERAADRLGGNGNTWPQFLPDGRHFLWLTGGQGKPGLYAGSIDSLDRKRILDFPRGTITGLPLSGRDSFSNAARLPSQPPDLAERTRGRYAGGYLFFVRQQALMAQRFSPERLELSGDPVRVVEAVQQNAPGRSLFDVTDRVLAYRPPVEERTIVRLVWFDRTGREVGTLGDPGSYNAVALSRDGRYALASTGSSGLVRVDTGSGIPTPVGLRGQSPVWAADGKRFALAGGRVPGPFPSIATFANPDDVRQLDLPLRGQAWPSDWSTDGRYIVGAVLNAETAYDLWAADVSANPMTVRYLIRAQGDQGDQRISPDGRYLAYASNERSETFEVYVRPFPEGPGSWRVSPAGGRLPTWSADGRELIYLAPDGTLMRVAVATGQEFKASTPQPLFRHDALRRGFNRDAIVGRPFDVVDGRRILVAVPISDPPKAPIVVVLNWQQLLAR